MRGIAVRILLAFFVPTVAKMLMAKQTTNAQDSTDNLTDKLLDKLLDRLLDCSLDTSLLYYLDLDDTTLAKPGTFLFPTSWSLRKASISRPRPLQSKLQRNIHIRRTPYVSPVAAGEPHAAEETRHSLPQGRIWLFPPLPTSRSALSPTPPPNVSRGAADRAIWCPPEKFRGTPRLPLAIAMEKIVARCKELQSPQYKPPWWAKGTWANLLLFMFKNKAATWLGAIPPLQRETLTTPDGSRISIDYNDDDRTRALSNDAPIVIVLHPITGSGSGMAWFLREAASRGWRGCVFNRRGHSQPLATPSFNLMGNLEDTRIQVAAVQKRYPGAFLSMVGISAGSGLIVSYLGACGADTPIRAGCSLCPGYDISKAFPRLSQKYPFADSFILKDVKREFIQDNKKVLMQHDPKAVDECLQAGNLSDFCIKHVPFTGASDLADYWKRNNPMEFLANVSVPLLVLNSEDDIVCLPENIREDLVAESPGIVLLRTTYGSHCAYCEGSFGGGSYLCRVSLDFLEAAKAVSQKP